MENENKSIWSKILKIVIKWKQKSGECNKAPLRAEGVKWQTITNMTMKHNEKKKNTSP